MKTSTAESHGYTCPECGHELTHDPSGKGYVRHKSRDKAQPTCPLGLGERDEPQVRSENMQAV
jgi:transcription initiation factor IIE alpha subunit